MKLTDKLSVLPGMGDKLAEKFSRLGIETISDLLSHYPSRYEDYSHVISIRDAQLGLVTFQGEIIELKNRYGRKGLHITEAVVADDTGRVGAIWFNQPYLAKSLPLHEPVYLSGELALKANRISLQHPTIERVANFTRHTARIIPIYPETEGLTSRQIRRFMAAVIDLAKGLEDLLPEEVRAAEGLYPRAKAIQQLHFPDTSASLIAAQKRLGFEELFELMLASRLSREELGKLKAPVLSFDEESTKKFVSKLGFNLTDAQRQAAWEIIKDLGQDTPMNRLLEGDVGSGKTVVAAMAVLQAKHSGYQSVLLAPTEILAQQHADTLLDLLGRLGIKVALLRGGPKTKARLATLAALQTDEVDLVVGTHALIEPNVKFRKLGLVIVDEQHRFGVRQRLVLQGKSKLTPHLLTMTATPIPRTLALTVYGELDVSIIDELPAGRKPVQTKVVNYLDRSQVYGQIENQLQKGQQAYVICPLIEPSDFLGARSVTEEYQRLQKSFARRRVGMLHGKLKAEEKAATMAEFAAGKLDILVSTTVIEVGVNVPNATIILVEGAERFGLAQLHQLRGRIKRGVLPGHCYLIASAGISVGQRLRAMEETDDGFKLAELDLALRGPGAIYGTRQSGLLDLAFTDITDQARIREVKRCLDNFLKNPNNLLQYPQLLRRVETLRSQNILN